MRVIILYFDSHPDRLANQLRPVTTSPGSGGDLSVESGSPRSGLITVEIVPGATQGFDLRITHTFDDPRALLAVGIVLNEIARRWSVPIETSEAESRSSLFDRGHSRRGGPTGTPEGERIEIVRGWLRVRGRMNQEVYAATRGISASTLRRWLSELQHKGKL